MKSHSIAKLSCCVPALLLMAAATAQDITPAPFDMPSNALNVVCTTADEAQTRAFYAEILGLPEISPIQFPDGPKMIRFMAGASELKFIIDTSGLPKLPGGLGAARGIRQLTIFLNNQKDVLDRLKQGGHDTSLFYDVEGKMMNSGQVRDPDDNELDLVFLPASMTAEKYRRMRIGLTVADMAASRKFYTSILGLREDSPSSGGGGNQKHLFQAGATGIRLMHKDPNLPATPALHTDSIGMHYIQFIVRDFDAVYETMNEKKATIVREPFDLGELARIFFVADPDGIIIEFVGPRAQ